MSTRLVPPERRKVEYLTLTCLQCGAAFECHPAHYKNGRRKFCKRECRTAHLATLTGEKSPQFGKRRGLSATAKIGAAARNRELGRKQRGEKHPAWKGGKYERAGYRIALVETTFTEQHWPILKPMASRSGYVPEHRAVAAIAAGRSLTADEVVHHVNGIKLDNRPENLEIVPRSDHSRDHRETMREIAALRREVRRLRSLLTSCRCNGSGTLSLPGT